MTKREALSILIRHASENIKGVGCGIRQLPSQEERHRVIEAIGKVFKDAYGRKMETSDIYNIS